MDLMPRSLIVSAVFAVSEMRTIPIRRSVWELHLRRKLLILGPQYIQITIITELEALY